MASFNIVAEEITFFIFPLCPPSHHLIKMTFVAFSRRAPASLLLRVARFMLSRTALSGTAPASAHVLGLILSTLTNFPLYDKIFKYSFTSGGRESARKNTEQDENMRERRETRVLFENDPQKRFIFALIN